MLRVYTVPRLATTGLPQEDVEGGWVQCTPEMAGSVSALGYFFGRELVERLGVAVGVVVAAWGGTDAEAWLSARAGERLGLPTAPDEPTAGEQEAYRGRLGAWARATLPKDPGNLGLGWGWARPDFDDTRWPEIVLPGTFQQAGWFRTNGSVWFRRTVPLPTEWRGEVLRLELGCVDDFAKVYVNGALVGEDSPDLLEGYLVRRSYLLGAERTEVAALCLAVRVYDHLGEGGLVGPAGAMRLVRVRKDCDWLALHGRWRHLMEQSLGVVPGGLLDSRPAPPAGPPAWARPGALFNGMIAPLSGVIFRGVVWYQGENNASRHSSYARVLRALIQEWRGVFGGERQAVFLAAQLPGWAPGGRDWALLRAAQAEALGETEGAGLACLLDAGERDDIHPVDKRTPAARLVRLARRLAYQESTVVTEGPRLAEVMREGARVRLRFASAAGLRTADGGPPKGFAWVKEDAVGQDASSPAEARIEDDTVVLTWTGEGAPPKCAYAFTGWTDVNLINSEGLPAWGFGPS